MIRLDAISLRQLKAFMLVAEAQSLTAAAERMGLTTPAVHSQIRNLETAIGLPLLHRGKDQGFGQLTEEGRILLGMAREIDTLLQRASNRIEALAQGRAGVVRLAAVSTAKYFAPRLVRLLRDALPEVDVHLIVANREGIIAALNECAVDMAIMGRPPRDPPLEAAMIGPHPHGLLAPADHRLAHRELIGADDLRAETFIAREHGSGTRILMNRFLESLDEEADYKLVEMTSNETVKQSILAGLGIAFLSLHTVQEELANGRLVCLKAPGLPIMRSWFLVHPHYNHPTHAAQSVWNATLALKAHFLPELKLTEPRPTEGSAVS